MESDEDIMIFLNGYYTIDPKSKEQHKLPSTAKVDNNDITIFGNGIIRFHYTYEILDTNKISYTVILNNYKEGVSRKFLGIKLVPNKQILYINYGI
jgi:hypothetical protein